MHALMHLQQFVGEFMAVRSHSDQMYNTP